MLTQHFCSAHHQTTQSTFFLVLPLLLVYHALCRFLLKTATHLFFSLDELLLVVFLQAGDFFQHAQVLLVCELFSFLDLLLSSLHLLLSLQDLCLVLVSFRFKPKAPQPHDTRVLKEVAFFLSTKTVGSSSFLPLPPVPF